jgi:hypothetical protein
MKTRVVRVFDLRNATYVYHVQKWALWDPPDLRAAYPDKFDWRYVRSYPDEATAVHTALQLSQYDDEGVPIGDGSGDVVASFPIQVEP